MSRSLSVRLRTVVDALPLWEGVRVLEIGCGTGAAAREVARRVGHGRVHAVDRSAKAIATAVSGSRTEIEAGRLSFQQIAIEEFELPEGEARFDLAFACRVGALDGRHPEAGQRARLRIAEALTPTGRLLIDTGDPLTEVQLLR
jgi:SAM-dependent methyltransferase